MAHIYETGSTGMFRGEAGYFYRVSWGGIFAGTLVALGTQLLLMLLGMGIGFGIINPVTQESLGAIGVGAGIWILASSLISLFIGGWVACRISGVSEKLRSALHGLVVWSLFTFTAFYLMTSAAGGLISGFSGVIGRSASILSGEVAGVTPEMAETAMNTASGAAVWGFLALLLSAAAAVTGAWAGRAKEVPPAISSAEERERRRAA